MRDWKALMLEILIPAAMVLLGTYVILTNPNTIKYPEVEISAKNLYSDFTPLPTLLYSKNK